MIDRFPKLRAVLSAYFLKLDVIYYWVDHTCIYPSNSGIQRVVRGLARALLKMDIKVVPVKWDEIACRFYPPTIEELQHLTKWNGPQPSEWSPWADPAQKSGRDWILIPELTTYLARTNWVDIKRYAAANRLRCAWIFYDAIPWKMQDIYPSEARLPHQHYMEGLNQFERVFAISEHSRADLSGFLAATQMPTPNLDERVLACVLPGEFVEASRVMNVKTESGATTKILCVGTVEPRKNHLCLLEAFARIIGQTQKPLELWLVGSAPLPDLAERVEHYISTVPGIRWERNTDDTRLRELYAECDFTVYPSLEEGFGLPVLESLWNARPCICRDSSAMAELAEGGGCLTAETADASELGEAMLRLIEDGALRLQLAREATTRHFKTWHDYGREIAIQLAMESVN
jgi:glycosyltransferase involved in cell wall biosynthesis